MRKQKVLIWLFAGSLILPNVIFGAFSDKFNTQNNENRELAAFPEVSLSSLGEFPEAFEEFYKDHLPFKNALVSLNNYMDTSLFRNTKIGDVVIGKDNWLFYLPSKDGETQWLIIRRPICIPRKKAGKLRLELPRCKTGSTGMAWRHSIIM